MTPSFGGPRSAPLRKRLVRLQPSLRWPSPFGLSCLNESSRPRAAHEFWSPLQATDLLASTSFQLEWRTQVCDRSGLVRLDGGPAAQRLRRSMHGHGLAVDIISLAKGWDYSDEWKADLKRACERLSLTCGGLWKSPVDWPHVQWGSIPGAVPDSLVAAYNAGGLYGSWASVGALR